MINKFKALDNIGLISYLRKLVLAIRQFFATKSEMDVVATALTDLDARKVDISDLVDYDVTVTEQGESGNILKSYVISQGGSVIGTISIPKDLIVSSGSVVVGDWINGVFTENTSGTGKAIKLVISNQSEPIYINVQDLANVYTAQQGATEIQLAISNTNEISATLVKSVRDKINNAITTSNYNSYSPTLTGSGAFGTWRIDISGNADTSDYAAYLRGRDGNGVYFGKETSSNIIAEWNTKSDNRWYLKAASTNQCRVEYADKVDWTGIDNKPSYFTPSSHTHTTSEITNFPTIGNGALHLKVNGIELTPEGGIFTANKGDNSTINITVPTAESIEESTLNKLGDKVVLKNGFTTELAKEMAEVLSGKNSDKGLVFNFTNPASPGKIECNPDILSVNYINVGDYYRLNIAGSFVLNGFNFYEQKLQDNYNPVLYSVISGTINNVELSAKKTGMLYFRLSDQQVSTNGAYGPVMFELSVFVESLSTDYNNGIYGSLDITQFYS